MTEDELDALIGSRSYGTKDATRAEAQTLQGMTLLSTLGVALWGKSDSDAQRQLLKQHPEIPSGYGLADFRELLRICDQMTSAVSAVQKATGMSHLTRCSRTIHTGSESFTLWEARCEIVRRAIDFLETH